MNAFTKANVFLLDWVHKIESRQRRGISGIVGAASNSFLTLLGSFLYTNIVFLSTYGGNINICLRDN